MSIGTLFFIGLTCFLAFKLYEALGKDTGPIERKPGKSKNSSKNKTRKQDTAQENSTVIDLPLKEATAQPAPSMPPTPKSGKASAEVKKQVAAVKKIDPAFDLTAFCEGAGMAYAQILDAFSRWDEETLRNLVSDEVYKAFEADHAAREKEGETLYLKVEEVKALEVKSINLKDSTARVTVFFKAGILSVIKDDMGRIVEGDPQTAEDTDDTWVFERDLKSDSLSWILVATE